MKKLLCLLLAAVMLLLCAAPALAEEPVWSINANMGALKAKNRTKLEGHITVPAEVEGTKVLRLDYMCFSGSDAVTGFTLPDTLRYFDRNTFQNLRAVSALTLPSELIIIKSAGMDGMDKLESLVIPPAVSVVHGAILNCGALKSVTFEGVCPVFPHDDNYATFHNLHPECVIYVPDDQLDAYKAAFADDAEVLGRIQPSGKNAVVIDWTAPESDFDFDAATGTITAYKGTAGRVTIPATIGGVAVRHIGKAFMKNYGLYYVTVPEGVETIDTSAFRLCNGLNYVELPSTLKSIGDTAFNGCTSLVGVAWSEGLESIGKDAFSSTDLRHVQLPASLRTIGENAFYNAYMKTLSFGGSLESIGVSAFSTNRFDKIVYNGTALPQMDATSFEKNTKDAELILPDGCSAELADGFTSYMATVFPACVVKVPVVEAPAPAPADGGAFPALDASAGAAYIGYWSINKIVSGSDEVPPSLLGMDAWYMQLNEDGTADMLMDGPMSMNWFMQDGVAYIGPSMDDLISLAIDGSGMLVLDMGDPILYYAKGDAAAAAPAPAPAPAAQGMPALDESAAPYIGTWNGDTIEMNGEEIALSMLMMQADVVLNEDGTAKLTVFSRDMFDGDPTYWCVVDGAMKIGPSLDVGFTMSLMDDGRLLFDMGDGTLIRFVKKVDAPAAAPLDPGEIGEKGAVQAAMPVSAANPTSYTERRFVCTGALQGGAPVDPIYLPPTSITFHADGTATAMIYGVDSPNSPWMAGNMGGEDIIQLTYLGYTQLTLKFVEGGLDMDYMGIMTLHLEPEN